MTLDEDLVVGVDPHGVVVGDHFPGTLGVDDTRRRGDHRILVRRNHVEKDLQLELVQAIDPIAVGDGRSGLPRPLFQDPIGIEEREAQPLCDRLADRGLAGAHLTDQEEVTSGAHGGMVAQITAS
jgi:hypothetical protein